MCGACMMGDAIEIVENLPPVTPKSLDSMLDKVRAEIEEMKLDEAIKCIEEMVEIGETYEVGKVVEENIQLAEWLKELKQLREQYRWIPVSERLPEDGRPVLIYAWNVHHVIARYDEFRTANGYKKTWVTADAWNGNTKIKHKVIAWMPLPEPYREGESE